MSKPSNLFRLEGRTAFLSGAAGHLGRSIARGLGAMGARIILNGRNAERLEAFAGELARESIASECAAFDMADFKAVRAFFGIQRWPAHASPTTRIENTGDAQVVDLSLVAMSNSVAKVDELLKGSLVTWPRGVPLGELAIETCDSKAPIVSL